MHREETIRANDTLRTSFKGGRIELHHGPFEIDDRTLGRMLCVLVRYNKFGDESLHDWGTFIFAGFAFEFRIEVENGERVLRVWVTADALNGAG